MTANASPGSIAVIKVMPMRCVGRRAPSHVDPSWWLNDQFEGRPLTELLRKHDVGAVFRFLRSRGWSQSAIAAATGTTENQVRAVIRGRQRVTSYQVLERIAEGLNIPRGLMGLAYGA